MSTATTLLYTVPSLACVVALCATLGLAHRHRQNWMDPVGQRHTLAILALMPVYSLCSLASIVLPRAFIYFDAARELYEAFVLYQLLQLLLHLFYQRALLHCGAASARGQANFVSPNALPFEERRSAGEAFTARNTADMFVQCDPVQPCARCCPGWEIWPSEGKLLAVRVAVAQYAVARALYSFAAILLQNAGQLHHRSLEPQYPYLWLTLAINCSVSLAVLALLYLVTATYDVVWMHDPLLKLAAIKVVVFFIFWQSILFSALAYVDVISPALFRSAAGLGGSAAGGSATAGGSAAGTVTGGDNSAAVVDKLCNALICCELAVLSCYNWWIFRWDEKQRTSLVVAHTTLAPGQLD